MKKISIAFYSTFWGSGYKSDQLCPISGHLIKNKTLIHCYGLRFRRQVNYNKEIFKLSFIPLYFSLFSKIIFKIFKISSYYSYLLGEIVFGFIYSNKIAKDDSNVLYCKPRPLSIIVKSKIVGKKIILDYGEIHPREMQLKLEYDYAKYPVREKMYTSEYAISQSEKAIEYADIIIVLSNYSKKTFIKHGVDGSKIMVSPLGVVNKVNNNYIDTNKPYAFISTAFHSYVKGTHYLLTAWKKADIKDMKLLIIGSLYGDIKEFIAKKGPFDNVVFYGDMSQENILQIYNRYNAVGISFSLADGGPRTVIEYIANSMPVIVTPTATCDIVKDKENGFIVDFRDVKSLVQKMQYFSHNRSKILEMGCKAGLAASQRTNSNFINDIIKFLEQYL